VAALEHALALDPDNPVLRGNLETFRRLLKTGGSAGSPPPNG
jgi:hypothetical protein